MPKTFLPQEPLDQDDPYHAAGHDDEPFEHTFVPPRDRGFLRAASSCPTCQSTRVDARNLGRKTGSAIGTIAGATSGVVFALAGTNANAVIGIPSRPTVAGCGAVAGAVIAGLIGGAAGCATGAVFGEIVDDKVLDNFRCHACGHIFSQAKPPV